MTNASSGALLYEKSAKEKKHSRRKHVHLRRNDSIKKIHDIIPKYKTGTRSQEFKKTMNEKLGAATESLKKDVHEDRRRDGIGIVFRSHHLNKQVAKFMSGNKLAIKV